MPPTDHDKRRLVDWLRAELARTGRRYRIHLDALDLESLRELQRLLRDLDADKRAAQNRARTFPWRTRTISWATAIGKAELQITIIRSR